MRLWLTQSVNQASHTYLSEMAQKEVLLLNPASGLFCISSLVLPGIYPALVSPGPQLNHTCIASQSPTEYSWDF